MIAGFFIENGKEWTENRGRDRERAMRAVEPEARQTN